MTAMSAPLLRKMRWVAALALLALGACRTAPVAPPVAPPVIEVPVVPPVAEVVVPKPPPRPPRIGLALGGGAARGSSAVPAVFQPVRIGTREYVDGGLVSPVPVRFARQMGAEVVIAVDISAAPEGNPTGDPMRMLLQTFAIMGRSINSFELREADIVLRPKLPGVSGADFTARKRSIQAGRDAALALMADLRSRIAAKTK